VSIVRFTPHKFFFITPKTQDGAIFLECGGS
jgi:hypothetical protein